MHRSLRYFLSLLVGDFREIEKIGDDIDDELRSHLQSQAERLAADGYSNDKAEQEAKARFGDILSYRRQCLRESGVFTHLLLVKLLVVGVSFLLGIWLTWSWLSSPKSTPGQRTVLLPAVDLATASLPGLAEVSHGLAAIEWWPGSELHRPEVEDGQSIIGLVGKEMHYLKSESSVVWERPNSPASGYVRALRYRVRVTAGQQPAAYGLAAAKPTSKRFAGRLKFQNQILAIEGISSLQSPLQLDYISGWYQVKPDLWLRLLHDQRSVQFLTTGDSEHHFDVVLSESMSPQPYDSIDFDQLDNPEMLRRLRMWMDNIKVLPDDVTLNKIEAAAQLEHWEGSTDVAWQRALLILSAYQLRLLRCECEGDDRNILQHGRQILPLASRFETQFPEIRVGLTKLLIDSHLATGDLEAANQVVTDYVTSEVVVREGELLVDILCYLLRRHAQAEDAAIQSRLLVKALESSQRYGLDRQMLHLAGQHACDLITQGEFERAIEIAQRFEPLQRRHSDTFESYYMQCQLTVAETEAGRESQSFNALKTLIDERPDTILDEARYMVFNTVSWCEQLHKNYEAAIRLRQYCLEKMPPGSIDQGVQSLLLAELLIEVGQIDEAWCEAIACEDLISAAPEILQYHREVLSRILEQHQLHAEAIASLREANSLKAGVSDVIAIDQANAILIDDKKPGGSTELD